jgi:hypothetical protein
VHNALLGARAAGDIATADQRLFDLTVPRAVRLR